MVIQYVLLLLIIWCIHRVPQIYRHWPYSNSKMSNAKMTDTVINHILTKLFLESAITLFFRWKSIN